MTLTYTPRALRSLGTEAVAGWSMKNYAINVQGAVIRPALISATLAKAAQVLPSDPFTQGRHGAGFVISHDAVGVCFGLIYWWQGDNELHQRLFMAGKDEPDALEPILHPAAGCVWELDIIDFERRAWRADVLANPEGPDVQLYMSRALNADL